MGDRANVYIHNGDAPGVYLYTHNSGWQLPDIVRTALWRGQSRWNDDQYLARIVFGDMARVIFTEMTAGDPDGLTGFGISAEVGDGDNRIVDVDMITQTVTLVEDDTQACASFADYADLTEVRWFSEAPASQRATMEKQPQALPAP